MAVGLFAEPLLCVAWLAFCLASFAELAWSRRAHLRSPYELAGCIPFAFGVISGIWIVGGSNDLRILGFGETFSYYAALHSIVLGWMMVGSIAILATQDRPFRKAYLASAFVCFASFLLIAFGINGLPAIKPIGVVGLSMAIPIAQLLFLKSVWRTNTAAFALSSASLLGLVLTLILAWQNELGTVSFPRVLGIRPMVSVHGIMNGALVAPSFLFAVTLEDHRA